MSRRSAVSARGRNEQNRCCVRFLLAVSLFGLLFLPCKPLAHAQSVPPAREQEHPYSITSEVNLVVLPATVTDREGRFVSGLGADNFRIFDHGQQQKITLFRAEDAPVTVAIVVDHSSSMARMSSQVVAGAMALTEAGNPQDQTFVVNFNDKARLGLPDGDAFTSQPEEIRAALSNMQPRGRTALYDALALALDHLREGSAEKKVLLLISDGGDNASRHSFAQVQRAAEESNTMIYAIGLFDPTDADQNPGVLKRLAQITGGRAYFPATDQEVVELCRRIAADIRHQYTLGFSPPNLEAAGKYRQIRLSVAAPGRGRLIVRTRPGYMAPPASGSVSAFWPRGN